VGRKFFAVGRKFFAVVPFVMIPVGAALAGWFFHLASIPNLARYTFGDRGVAVAGVEKVLGAALLADLGLIAGDGLLLGGFAWIFRRGAISVFGRVLSVYVLGAVGVMVAADLIEDGLLALTLHYGTDPVTLITATAAAATIKWCAALLALAGIPAAVAIGGRAAMGRIRQSWRLRKARKGAAPADIAADSWWDRALDKPELPKVGGAHAAEVSEAEWSWVDSYNVPGANQVIADRDGAPVQAICLSGGGVRSACVAMGAMQVFSKKDPIDKVPAGRTFGGRKPRLIDAVDYVISVSGGGYSAGARLLATQPTGVAPDEPLVSQRYEEGSVEFDHFRRGSSYIADSPAGLIRALAEVLKNLVASLVTLFVVPVILGWVAGYLLALPYWPMAALVPVPNEKVTDEFKREHPDFLWSLVDHSSAWWAAGLFAFLAVSFTMGAIFAEWVKSGAGSERWRLRMMRLSQASAIFGLLVLTVTAGVPGLMRLCVNLGTIHAAQHAGATAAAITSVIGLNYVTAIMAMVWKKTKIPVGDVTKPSWWKSILPPGVWQMVLVLVTLGVLGAVWLITLGSFAAGVFRQMTADGIHIQAVPNWQSWIGGLAATALFLGFADVTSLSLHPFYRLRLARTFAIRRLPVGQVPGPGPRTPQAWRAQWYDHEWTWLHKKGRVPAGGPRFVFAAAATITGRAKPAPGLNAVSYVLSADHIGGPELGWFKTCELFNECPPRLRRDLTVEASVAISGAAFASAMGRQNKGFQKLLAVSGARLGTWLPNPTFAAKLACAAKKTCADPADITKPWPKSLPTIRGASYFYRELFAFNYQDARLIQVTDGGHYENLGLVEALRRRSRLIICIDGGGDTPPLAGGLTDAMRLAEYELGVTITLSTDGPYAVDNIAPGSGKLSEPEHALASLKQRVTKSTVVVGTISYPPAAGLGELEGVLIFAKAVLWERCPYWLLTYAAAQPRFPHDPTSDQWFNEGQFAAYTELGRIMAEQVMQCVKQLEAI
jgi:hypothetical protein